MISLTLLKRFNGKFLRSTVICQRHLQLVNRLENSVALPPTWKAQSVRFGKMPLDQTITSVANPEITICIAQKEDNARLLQFIRDHYYREEPLTVGSEPKQQEPADEEFNMSNIKHGTCLMAINHLGDGVEEVVAAAIAGPKDPHEVDHLFEDSKVFGLQSKWGRILHILACIERDANVFERYGVKRALHTHVLSVHQKMRGHALGTRLMQELMAVGHNKDFELLTADCSSVFSARICERLGMECVNTLRYEDYRDADGNQIFKPPMPHDTIKTYAMRL